MSEQTCTTPIRFGPIAPSLLALRGIRFFNGEGGAGGEGGGEGGSGGSGNDQGGGGNDGGQGGDGSNGGGNDGAKPKPPRERQETFGRQYVEDLRTEAATNRKNAGTEKTRADTAERERDEARGRIAELERRDAVRDVAAEAGGNAAALLDSGAFARATKDLDLTDRAAVKKAVEDFVKEHPHTAAAPTQKQGAGSSGSGRPGGRQEQPKDTSNDLSGALRAAMTPQ